MDLYSTIPGGLEIQIVWKPNSEKFRDYTSLDFRSCVSLDFRHPYVFENQKVLIRISDTFKKMCLIPLKIWPSLDFKQYLKFKLFGNQTDIECLKSMLVGILDISCFAY